MVVVGRESERAAVERVVADARQGRSRALVLRGDPGVGKTTLLRAGLEAADGMRVVRATGVESEAELEYSGLLELVRPLLDLLERLPVPQAQALRVALGLDAGGAADRFLVGAATLSLLAAAGEDEPLLVVVDDAQWVDRASVEAVRFAARRLLADGVGFLVATRPEGFEAHGLDEMRLLGLDAEDVARLAAGARGVSLSDAEVASLVEATAGNPLAVLELARGGRHLAETAPTVPLPVTEAIERAFAGRLAALPERSRRALCVVAAAGGDGAARIVATLGLLELETADLGPAEDAGLIEIGPDAMRFSHPLLRSVAYHERPGPERRAVHRALAAASGPAEGEARAWHLAAAAVGLDDEAAEALAALAETARARGGTGVVAAALERAARLTTDDAERRARLVRAAHAAWDAGDAERAGSLVAEVLDSETDPGARARAAALAGRIEFQAGSLEQAHALLADAAATLVDLGDRSEAVTVMGLGSLILHNLARVADAIELGRRAVEVAAGEPEEVRMRAAYHLGRALQIAGRTDEAEPLLDTVVAHLLEPETPSRFALQRAAIALAVLGRPNEAMPLARATLALAQATGPLQVVYALSLLAQVEMHAGEWREAAANAAEGHALSRDLGQDNVAATFASFLVRLAGARGDREAFSRWEPEARAAVSVSGNRFERLQLDHAGMLLALADDRLEEAAEALVALVKEAESLGVLDRDLAPEPDLVEALVRQGRVEDARRQLERWIARDAEAAREWAPPLVARCRAMLAPEDEIEDLFDAAVEGADHVGDPFMAARTRLVRGERLRRAGRRVDARRELVAACEVFDRLEATAWVERARRELRASGARLRRGAEAGDTLTPQELQIALQVAEGKANKEVAAALFLSPKTVEFHLSRIYRKLGIGSRAELVVRMTAQARM